MKIYKYSPNPDEYDSFIEDIDWTIIDKFSDYDSLKDIWNPVALKPYYLGRESDFPTLSFSVPIISLKALDILKPILANVEVLPLINKEYVALNVLSIDCLDITKSKVTVNSVIDQVSSIQKYSFDFNKLQGIHLFRIPETKSLEVYISDTFKSICEENNLVGLDFDNLIAHH